MYLSVLSNKGRNVPLSQRKFDPKVGLIRIPPMGPTVQNLKKGIICSLSVLCSPRLFLTRSSKSLAKISQRPENRKDWSK